MARKETKEKPGTAPKYEAERREKRHPVLLEIEVTGIDHNGRLFRQRALTRNVSRWGCGFLSATPLKRGDIISLRLISGAGKETAQTPQLPFQVVHVQPANEGWTVGAVKMEEEEMWGAHLVKTST